MVSEEQDSLQKEDGKPHRLVVNTNTNAIHQASLSEIAELVRHSRESLASMVNHSMSLSVDVALETVKYESESLKRFMEDCMTLPLSGLKEATISLVNQTLDFSWQDELKDLVSHALEVSMPYMPEEQKHECQSVLDQALSPEAPKRLTFNDLLGLFNLLLAVLTVVIALMPDPQLDKISAQNDRLIEIEEERLELERERTNQIENAVQALTDAIVPLYDQIEDMSHLIQDSDHPDVADRQQADGNALDRQDGEK